MTSRGDMIAFVSESTRLFIIYYRETGIERSITLAIYILITID